MTDFEDFTFENNMELTLNQETLGDLRHRAAEALVLRGRITEERGLSSLDGRPVKKFSYPLSPDLVREVFQPDDQETIVPEGCQIEYIPESVLDGVECQDKIYMVVTTQTEQGGGDSPLTITKHWAIDGDEGQPINGEQGTEYSIGEERVSPHDFDLSSLDLTSLQDVGNLVDDLDEYNNPMTVDDLDKFEQVIEAIWNSPTLDNEV